MTQKSSKLTLGMLGKVFGVAFFVYLFFGFMLLPCLNTITQIFTTTDSTGNIDPLAVIRFFFAGNMPSYVLNSLKLAVCLVITVNIVGISIVLLTEYFDIKGAKILRLGYMTTLIYSGVALVTGYLFLYDSDGIMTTWLSGIFPNMDKNWFSGFNAVLFTMTFACTSNHALFLRNAIRGIDYNTVEAARNMGASGLMTFLRVKLPIILPSVLAVFALNFNALFTEYDMSATFQSSYGKTYAMIIQNMCAEEGRDGYNVNASGRRCASTVFIMVISGLILYLVYGVGARDLGERIERREKRRKRIEAFKAKFTGKKKAAEKAAA